MIYNHRLHQFWLYILCILQPTERCVTVKSSAYQPGFIKNLVWPRLAWWRIFNDSLSTTIRNHEHQHPNQCCQIGPDLAPILPKWRRLWWRDVTTYNHLLIICRTQINDIDPDHIGHQVDKQVVTTECSAVCPPPPAECLFRPGCPSSSWYTAGCFFSMCRCRLPPWFPAILASQPTIWHRDLLDAGSKVKYFRIGFTWYRPMVWMMKHKYICYAYALLSRGHCGRTASLCLKSTGYTFGAPRKGQSQPGTTTFLIHI